MNDITKTCIDCNETKSITNFYKAKEHKHGVMSYCSKCFSKRCIQRWINLKIEMVNYYGGECNDCNLKLEDSHYSVYEFHHLDPTQKDVSWTKLRLRSKDKIHKELSKCVLLCANCHRIRHYKNS